MSVANTSDAIGTNVVTVARTTSTTAQWTYDNNSSYLTDGKATLTNVSSPTGKMLDVEGVNVDIWNHTGSGCQHFTIFRSNNPDYSGLYCIRYGPYFVTQHTDNNVYLSTTATAASFWSFMKVDKGTVSLTTFDYTSGSVNYDTTTNNGLFGTSFDLQYTNITRVNPLVSASFEDLKTSDVYIYRGHGGPGILAFKTTNDVTYGIIGSNNNITSGYSVEKEQISSITHNGLANARCVLYLGCSTGVTKTVSGVHIANLMYDTYDKGAHFVLGTKETTDMHDSNKFLEGFLEGVSINASMENCIKSAIRNVGSVTYYETTDDEYPIIYVGDISQCINY